MLHIDPSVAEQSSAVDFLSATPEPSTPAALTSRAPKVKRSSRRMALKGVSVHHSSHLKLNGFWGNYCNYHVSLIWISWIRAIKGDDFSRFIFIDHDFVAVRSILFSPGWMYHEDSGGYFRMRTSTREVWFKTERFTLAITSPLIFSTLWLWFAWLRLSKTQA